MSTENLTPFKNSLLLMKKRILINESEILYNRPVTEKSLSEDFPGDFF